MGFLDDLGKGLNKVGKKTSDMAAVTKMKLDITKNKSAIDKKYEALGSRVYFMNKEGLEPDESVQEIIDSIDELFLTIKSIEVEIEKLSADEKPKAVAVDMIKCSHCGMELGKDTKFCGGCGNKVEAPVEAIEKEIVEIKKCSNCGAEVGEAKFCNACGTSLE